MGADPRHLQDVIVDVPAHLPCTRARATRFYSANIPSDKHVAVRKSRGNPSGIIGLAGNIGGSVMRTCDWVGLPHQHEVLVRGDRRVKRRELRLHTYSGDNKRL